MVRNENEKHQHTHRVHVHNPIDAIDHQYAICMAFDLNRVALSYLP